MTRKLVSILAVIVILSLSPSFTTLAENPKNILSPAASVSGKPAIDIDAAAPEKTADLLEKEVHVQFSVWMLLVYLAILIPVLAALIILTVVVIRRRKNKSV